MSTRALVRSRGARILAALALLAGACLLGLLLLMPSQPGPSGGTADLSRFIDPAHLARAADYASGALPLVLASLVAGYVPLVLAALGRPRALAGLFARLDVRPLLGGLAAGAILSLLIVLAQIVFGWLLHQHAVDFGISVQNFGGWLADVARSTGIGMVFAAIGATLLLVLQRKLPRSWWAAGAAVVMVFAFVTTFLGPVVLAPLFSDFKELPPGKVRTEVVRLADEAGVDVGGVYSVDASQRTRSINAYVDGIGSSRRVVLYDTLIDDAEQPALRAVVAHELGHVADNDILRGLAFVAIIVLPGMLLVRECGDAIAGRRGLRPGHPSALAAYALPVVAVAFALGLVGNVLSRAVEERADRYALELTGEPHGMIQLQTELARRNLSDPDPPGWYSALFGTHPTPARRIGIAEAFAREQHPG